MTTTENTIGFYCAQCRQDREWKQRDIGGVGYATNASGEKICYACCADNDKTHMDAHGRITLYLVLRDGKHIITNWPSSLEYPVICISEGSHNIAQVRYDFQFKDHKGKLWYGTQYGHNTQIAHCRRYKIRK